MDMRLIFRDRLDLYLTGTQESEQPLVMEIQLA